MDSMPNLAARGTYISGLQVKCASKNTVGSSITVDFPVFWSPVPRTAIVSCTSTMPQDDVDTGLSVSMNRMLSCKPCALPILWTLLVCEIRPTSSTLPLFCLSAVGSSSLLSRASRSFGRAEQHVEPAEKCVPGSAFQPNLAGCRGRSPTAVPPSR